MKHRIFLVAVIAALFFMNDAVAGQFGIAGKDDPSSEAKGEELVVLWTSGDPEVAGKMVFMYVYNAKKNGWFDEITFIVWGPSSKLLAENEKLQEEVLKMKEEGVILKACKACADQYGVSGKLEELGIDVKYMGRPLTKYIKEGYHVVTF